jgi:putative transposase
MIEPGHPWLSIQRQCVLVSISRSGFYYQPTGESPLNLALMRLIDEAFLETPWYGSRQMARHLRRRGYEVGRMRVQRLMARRSIRSCAPRSRTRSTGPTNTCCAA